ncbi:MAG: glycosyl hydrolase family 28-related protein [Verrucomicrobiota bacterium]
MKSKSFARPAFLFLTLLPAAAFATATPYPPYPGSAPSMAYQVRVDGQDVFVHNFLTYDQFNWMDYASFSMTGKVHVEITCNVSARKVITCNIRPLAYGIQPKIEGNKVSFDLDQPRYLVIFFNDEPAFNNTGLLLFAEPPERRPAKPGDPGVVNIQDYNIDSTGKTIETAKINQAISDIAAKPGGGTLFFPKGRYLTGTIMMKSNVRFYVDVDAVILGSTNSADYAPRRAFVVFDSCTNASLAGRGSFDNQGYPYLWHDFQPDTGDGKARELGGKVIDPHRTGVNGYNVSNCRDVSFDDLLLLRAAYHDINVNNCVNFTNRNIKIVNRKQQYHDDAYNISGNHIWLENGFAMTMDDTWALHGTLTDFVVKGFVVYSYTCSLALGYGGVPNAKHVRLEDVNFVSNHNKFAIWIQSTAAYFVGRGYPTGARGNPLDDFRFVNCSFESDGGQVYIDGGDQPLTNFAFENCTFYKPGKPSLIMGSKVAPILFKNVKMNGEVLKSTNQLTQTGFDLSVPVKIEP